MKYEPVIGLEIHVELKTRTKMFCPTPNDPNEKHPNITVCPICMGHPGTLPVANEEAIRKLRLVGLALGGELSEFSQFDRKNYFYPDLPKGYQISQYQHPFVAGGYLDIEVSVVTAEVGLPAGNPTSTNYGSPTSTKRIRIQRIHLEEDTARLVHDDTTGATLVDFNRAGVPLMELVTEPDFRSPEEIKEFGRELQKILRYLEASDANMEKGQMRIEVNISLRPAGTRERGTKVEIKNINSFKFAADAAEYEIKRQSAALNHGEKIAQETRGWDEKKRETFSQRSKEAAHDYRYFPEPDLPPFTISKEEIEALRRSLPELPAQKLRRFEKEFGLTKELAALLTEDKRVAEYFEAAASELLQHDKETPEKPSKDPLRVAASLIVGDLFRILRKAGAAINDTRITPENFSELALYVAEEKISNLAAQEVLEEMFHTGGDPSDIIEAKGLWQKSNAADLETIANRIIKENPKAAADYRSGKKESLQFLVGRVMKDSGGAANPKIAAEALKKILEQ